MIRLLNWAMCVLVIWESFRAVQLKITPLFLWSVFIVGFCGPKKEECRLAEMSNRFRHWSFRSWFLMHLFGEADLFDLQ